MFFNLSRQIKSEVSYSTMKKSHNKRLLALASILPVVVFLAGCASKKPITAHSTGFWDHYVVWNVVRAIEGLSHIFGNNYGWGIVVFTIIIRIIILPLMIFQLRSSRKMMELQPQIKELQKKYPGKDAESRQKLAAAQQKLYQDAGANPMVGCLPLLIQMPVLYALYQAIYRSPVLKSGAFLWTQLGSKDPYFILPILAALFTYLTSKLSMMSQPESNTMTTTMTYAMPVMIFVMALNLPSALTLYWVVTNAFSALQTLLFNNPYKIRAERDAKVQAEKDRKRKLAKAKRRALRNRKKK